MFPLKKLVRPDCVPFFPVTSLPGGSVSALFRKRCVFRSMVFEVGSHGFSLSLLRPGRHEVGGGPNFSSIAG